MLVLKEQRRYKDQAADSALVASVTAGDKQALGALYDRHAARLRRVAIGVLGSTRDAEDVVHDVFLEFWQNSVTYDPRKSYLSCWLRRRTRSRAIDRRRASTVRRSYWHREIGEAEPIAEESMVDGEKSVAPEHLASLPPSQREVIVLMYWRGHTCQELAAELGVPLGTVKSRLSAGLRKLRRTLRDVQ